MFGLGTWLLSVVVLGAVILVVHAALLLAVWRAERSDGLHRALAIVPPFLPFVALRLGLRLLPLIWVLLVCAYLILRWAR